MILIIIIKLFKISANAAVEDSPYKVAASDEKYAAIPAVSIKNKKGQEYNSKIINKNNVNKNN